MYRKFFGLNSLPFKTTPELHMFYKDGSRAQILEALVYTVARGDGIVKVTGEVGSGKTMLLRLLATRLPKDTEIIYINSPNLSAKDILLYICSELKIDVSSFNEKFSLTNALQTKLVELHAKGCKVVMLIDEAQVMTFDALEEIRLLSNLETSDDKLLQMVLFGQPELDVAMENEKVRQIKSRITYSIYVPPFNAHEVHLYLNYRMRQAGYKGLDVFSTKVAKKIHKISNGLPRSINVIADKLLMASYGQGSETIELSHFKNLPDSNNSKHFNFKFWFIFALVLLIMGTIFAYLQYDLTKKEKQLANLTSLNANSDNDKQNKVNSLSSESTKDSEVEQKVFGDGGKRIDSNGLSEVEESKMAVLSKQGALNQNPVLIVEPNNEIDRDLVQGIDIASNDEYSKPQDENENTYVKPYAVLTTPDYPEPSYNIDSNLLKEPFESLEKQGKLKELLKFHQQSQKWLKQEQKLYSIQLSTRNIASLEASKKFYKNFNFNLEDLNILIDFNPRVSLYRIKVFYSTSDSFSEISKKIDRLPSGIKREGPFIVRVDTLKQKLQRTENNLKKVGIINE